MVYMAQCHVMVVIHGTVSIAYDVYTALLQIISAWTHVGQSTMYNMRHSLCAGTIPKHIDTYNNTDHTV